MKKLRMIAWALVSILISLSACSGGDVPVPDPPTPEVVKSEIIIDSNIIANGLSFTHEKGEQSISFSTNEIWSLSIVGINGSSDWCIPSATSGAKGTSSVTFRVTENTSYDDRSASVTIKSGTATKTFTITQKYAGAVLVDTDTYVVSPKGGMMEVKVNSNVEFEVQIPSDVSWITQTDSRALTEKVIYLKVEENPSTDDRHAEITLMNEEFKISERIIINQEGVVNGSYVDGVVTFEKPGTMKRVLGDGYLDITRLKVVGPMNGDDVRCLRQMLGGNEFDHDSRGKLASLDLSDARIVEGGEAYLEGHSTSDDVIGNSMFYFCTNLQDMVLPASVVSIGETAFYHCHSLTSIDIPANVTYIGKSAFMDCDSLGAIHVHDLSAWCRITHEDSSSSPFFCGGKLYLNNQVLTELFIPEDITELKPYAFAHCQSFTSVTMHADVTSIGDGAFDACYLLKSVKVGEGVTSIGNYAFYGCMNLISIDIPASVTSIGSAAFFDCSSLEDVYITDLSAWCKMTFDDNKSNPLYNHAKLYLNGQELRELVIPEDVTEIKPNAFSACSSLASVTIGDGVTSIGENAFNGCSSLASVTMGDGVTSIGMYAFCGCTSLASVTIGDGVTSIGAYAFYDCFSLATVMMGAGVTTIDKYAFDYCSSIKSVHITDLSAWCRITFVNMNSVPIGRGTKLYLNNQELRDLVIPADITELKPYAFYGVSSLTSVAIHAGVTSIGEFAFGFCTSIQSVHITDLSAWCKITFEDSFSNPLFHKGKLYLNQQEVTELVIPEDVTGIKPFAFIGCRSFVSVHIPASVTSIGMCAFADCSPLRSVHITDLSAWCKITFHDITANPLYNSKKLYLNNEKLTELVIPADIETIKNYAFYGCLSIEEVTFGEGVTSIGRHSFGNCISLAEVYCQGTTPPAIISSFGISSFDGSAEDRVLYVPKGCTSIYQDYDWSSFFGTIEEME